MAFAVKGRRDHFEEYSSTVISSNSQLSLSRTVTMEYITKQELEGHSSMIFGQYLPFIESETIEFKMHTNFTTEELPSWVYDGPPPPKNEQEKLKQEKFNGKCSRKPISRNFNAFLNSGKGGIVYMGIQDDGRIIGLHLSLDQMEHLRVSLEDVMFRYTPPVPAHLYQISFIPVVKNTKDKQHAPSANNTETSTSWKPKPTAVNQTSEKYYCHAHLVRTSKSCWCRQRMSSKQRKALPLYIVQVSIMPLPASSESSIVQPLYLDEEDKCYFRRSASVWQCTYSELIRRTTEQVAEYYLTKSALREERSLSFSSSL